MLEREDSPWYASMLLVRQTEFGEWEDAFETVTERLRFLATSRTSKTTSQRGAVLERLRFAAHAGESIQTAPAFVDSQAAEERAKYQRVWKSARYRQFSPGAAAIDEGSLIAALRRHGVRPSSTPAADRGS